MADYTRLTQADLEDILSLYDLGTLTHASPLEGGQANSSILLKSDTGSFTLSVCDEKSLDQIQTLVRVLTHLETTGFSSTPPVPAKDGRPVVEFQGKPVYVKTYLSGDICQNLSYQNLEEVGRRMAELHQIPLSRELKEKLPRLFPYGQEQFAPVINANIAHPFKNWLSQKKTWLEQHLDLSMAKGFIHGDIFWDNLLFENNRLKAVLDFEEACRYYLLFDLGMAVVGCCSEKGRLNMDKIGYLLKGYQTITPFSLDEKQQFSPFLIYAAAVAAFWRFRQYNIRYPGHKNADSYKELAELADEAMRLGTRDFFKA